MSFDPILSSVVTHDRDGRPIQQHAWCDWCEDIRSHSPTPGHRCAHCTRADCPYRRFGYTLAPAGKAATPEAVRPARIFVGARSSLAHHLGTVAPAMRNAFLRPLLGPNLERRIGSARVAARTGLWWIDPDVFPAEGEAKARPRMRPVVTGSDVASLLAALYGLALGVIAVRLLEAVTGLKLDAHAKLAIAAEVEASQARQAEGDR
ncbi:hypothetical protein [Methylobacterium sp. SyP6R]|uniref:hypothetical protein n=1 Tax=Methylobacterium sp. SyP6R TaxID=2718876 RepID=UPI001F2411E1|nr:hypothetical protein [Methylobacterium sp. SyP6R]MCF4130263.1 hypothetical protein [Methylobacterium sp. SyP6R]